MSFNLLKLIRCDQLNETGSKLSREIEEKIYAFLKHGTTDKMLYENGSANKNDFCFDRKPFITSKAIESKTLSLS